MNRTENRFCSRSSGIQIYFLLYFTMNKKNRKSFKNAFGSLCQVSRIHSLHPPAVLSLFHPYFQSEPVSFKCPCGTTRCLSTCRWLQRNCNTLLSEGTTWKASMRRTCVCVPIFGVLCVICLCCIGGVCLRDLPTRSRRHLAGQRLLVFSHVGPSQMRLFGRKGLILFHRCSGYPPGMLWMKRRGGREKKGKGSKGECRASWAQIVKLRGMFERETRAFSA